MRAFRGASSTSMVWRVPRPNGVPPTNFRIIASAPFSGRTPTRTPFRQPPPLIPAFPPAALSRAPSSTAAAAPIPPAPASPAAGSRWERFKAWLREDHKLDAAAEKRRFDQRVVFDHSRWSLHRAWYRFLDSVPIPLTAVMIQSIRPVGLVTLWTVVVCGAQVMMDAWFFHLPTSLMSISAPTLGLLLVFRNNTCYERWDGARKMIGLVKNRSEDLVRQACQWFPDDNPELKKKMLRYVQSFFFAIKVHIRSGPGGWEADETIKKDLTPILEPKELDEALKAVNRPAHILLCITRCIADANLETAQVMAMDQNLTCLSDVLGGCERIRGTPIPLSYTRMTTRFLLVWLFLLPLALSWEITKLGCTIWLTPGCVMFLAFLLLGVDEVAVQIEEPFTILPMEAYAEGSRRNTALLFAQLSGIPGPSK